MSHTLQLLPRDPVIARDGRPFGDAGVTRQHALPWLLPGTLAGAVRTLLGRKAGQSFDADTIESLKSVSVHGPFPVSEGQLFLPAPGDALATADGRCVRLQPAALPQGCGTDLPAGLMPVLPPQDCGLQKYVAVPAWWSLESIVEWLCGQPDAGWLGNAERFRMAATVDERTHVRIDPKSLAAEKQKLFSTQGIVIDRLLDPSGKSHPAELVCRVDSLAPDYRRILDCLDALVPVGGERRTIRFRAAEGADSGHLQCPAAIATHMANVRPGDRIRMVLAAPALFSAGWRPGWLNSDSGRVGVVPVPDGSGILKVRLLATANQRWEAVSGWSYETRGPKKVRRLVPAGAVYFFEVLSCESLNWSNLWLQSVCDEVQDRRDGFGLALWGLQD